MQWTRLKPLAVVLAMGVALPVMAQETATDLPEIPEIAAEDVTLGQVVSFVNAMIAVERVKKEYTGKIEEAESEDDINALIAEADKSAMAAVDEVVGISPGEYIAISNAAQGSEELTARIKRRFELMRQAQLPTVSTSDKSTAERIQEENEKKLAE